MFFRFNLSSVEIVNGKKPKLALSLVIILFTRISERNRGVSSNYAYLSHLSSYSKIFLEIWKEGKYNNGMITSGNMR